MNYITFSRTKLLYNLYLTFILMNISYYLVHLFIVTQPSFDFKLGCIFINIILLIILLSKKKTIISSPFFCSINPTNYSLAFSFGLLVIYSWVIGLTLFDIINQNIILDYTLYLSSAVIGVLISTCGCAGLGGLEIDQPENQPIPQNNLIKLFYVGFGIFSVYYGLKHATISTEKLIEILPEVGRIAEAIPPTPPVIQESLFKTKVLKILSIQPIINFCFVTPIQGLVNYYKPTMLKVAMLKHLPSSLTALEILKLTKTQIVSQFIYTHNTKYIVFSHSLCTAIYWWSGT